VIGLVVRAIWKMEMQDEGAVQALGEPQVPAYIPHQESKTFSRGCLQLEFLRQHLKKYSLGVSLGVSAKWLQNLSINNSRLWK
jgi:hypothetical protein